MVESVIPVVWSSIKKQRYWPAMANFEFDLCNCRAHAVEGRAVEAANG
jgi:hypothetical protein